jgi:hypothetical protein
MEKDRTVTPEIDSGLVQARRGWGGVGLDRGAPGGWVGGWLGGRRRERKIRKHLQSSYGYIQTAPLASIHTSVDKV